MKKTKKEILGRRKLGSGKKNAQLIILPILGLLIIAIVAKANSNKVGLILEKVGLLETSIDLQIDGLAARVEEKIEESRKKAIGGS